MQVKDMKFKALSRGTELIVMYDADTPDTLTIGGVMNLKVLLQQ